MNRNDLCWCGSGRKYKKCHQDYDEHLREMKFDFTKGQIRPMKKLINNPKDIEAVRAAGVVNDGALDLMDEMVQPGVDTLTLDNAVAKFLESKGAVSADLGFEGYPRYTCISVNDVVCHGIPSKDTILKEGDIVNVDITTKYKGYYADASRMYIVGGHAAENAERLVRVTRECMKLGIEAAKPWHFLGDIGAACGKHAHDNGYSVVTDLGGHGVGKEFHSEPFIPHTGTPGTGMLLVPGMIITVEPMINEGTHRVSTDKKDGWTVRTNDKKLSAQWENTILITETGNEILSS